MSQALRIESVEQCDHALRLARSGATRAGLNAARAAYRLARESADTYAERAAINVLCICESAHGLYIEAASGALDAFRAARAAKDRPAAAHALATLAGASSFILDTGASEIAVLEHCVREGAALGDAALECRAHNLLAIRLGSLGRFDEAEQALKRAAALVTRAGEFVRASMLALNAAALAAKRLHAAVLVPGPSPSNDALAREATARCNDALLAARAENNAAIEARVDYTLGTIASAMQRHDDALACYERAYHLERRLHSRGQLVNVCMSRAGALTSLGRDAEALQGYLIAFDEAVMHRPTTQTAAAAACLVTLFARMGEAAREAKWSATAEQERVAYETESAATKAALDTLWRELESTT